MVSIIDYGAGNLSSVKKALDYLGAENEITDNKDKILSADRVILPGVGSFGDAMASMDSKGLTDTVKAAAASGKPFLGICLGLQLMFEESAESPNVEGLSIFKGKIIEIPREYGLKVPHIGWNSVKFCQHDGLFDNIDDDSYYYFVHSFYLDGADDVVAGITEYGVPIQCAVQQGNVCATQFHPEKSGSAGLKLLKNFLKMEG